MTRLPRRSWYRLDHRMVRGLNQFKAERGLPKLIRVDNRSEMTSLLFAQWCEENGVAINYIGPGNPNQNAYI
ncbi:MAG TPA: transposase family protein [Alcaligenaceae bacterium]|nr:transposase family protein [Alcaligenaceae bacterium]